MEHTGSESLESSAPGSVLVADDDPTVLAMAQAALGLDGHHVTVARDGEQACQLFSIKAPDLVLLDVRMPNVGGFEVCEDLRGRASGERTPIVMLTGSNDAEAVSRAFEAGATDFQTKPLDWRVLRERVKYMLRSKRAADELMHLAHYDGLTGLPNRGTFRAQLERELRDAEAHGRLSALVFLDLDGFKEINDTYGHGFGDQVLKLTAERISDLLRVTDALTRPEPEDTAPVAGRFGGDEFTISVSNIRSIDAATAVANRIRGAFSRPFRVNGQDVFVTASTGVSVYPFDGSDADTLLKHADAAMYDAKATGRNKHSLYCPSMSAKASEKLALASELRQALDRDEFRLCFQPKVAIDSKRIIGAEALIRWQHPTRGLLAPSDFMAFGEEIGLGAEIGDWLLHECLAYLGARREKAGELPPIALNVSNSQFRVPGFVDHIKQRLAEYGLPARCLEIELTEDVCIHNFAGAAGLLAELKAVGIRTAIDDFGTGQSALGTLRQLPVDILKIDRSFIRDLTSSRNDRAITASIIDIGHHLGMTVIAEGVETDEQLVQLAELGCDQAQGFLFSPGVPPEDYDAYLVRHRREQRLDGGRSS